MKTLIASLLAVTAALSTLQAHCGTCSLSEGADGHHAEACAENCNETTLTSYFAIQKALAGDNLEAAKTAAAGLCESVSNSECSINGGECCSDMKQTIDSIAHAADIKSAREAFLGLSNTLIAQLESNPGQTTAYQMYCPMAFKGKGGAWLQDSKDLRNPYYGASMLTCGSQKATYGSAAKEASHDHSDHAAHNH